MTYKILVGNVLDRLKRCPDNSVHCVVTSPPYWGLRDYGTAEWEGGDPNCDHKRHALASSSSTLRNDGRDHKGLYEGEKKSTECMPEGHQCLQCGATRIDEQIGLEPTPEEFIAKLVEVFREVRRVLREDGTCWVNMGDSYAASGKNRSEAQAIARSNLTGGYGNQLAILTQPNKIIGDLKPKDMCGIPWMLAFALRADGWWLRQDIIWAKPNPMPESVTDRCTKAHEYLFLLTKSQHYFYDAEAIKEATTGGAHDRGQGLGPKASASGSGTKYNESFSAAVTGLVATRNKRSVWEIVTEGFSEAHFATFPTKLVEPCILAGTSEKGCCVECGAPWERVLSRKEGKSWNDHSDELAVGQRQPYGLNGGDFYKNYEAPQTIGWEPTCDCPSTEHIPCTVLDPFSGSGTTGVVALRYRRNYIGVELNPEYAEMSRRRIHDDNPMFNLEEGADQVVHT